MNGEERNKLIDVYRGVVILDMILLHFSQLFPKENWLQIFLNNVDFAVEGFIFISGFLVGRHYYCRFVLNEKKVTKKMLFRAFRLLIIQYFIIITISIPYYFFFELKNVREVTVFAIQSFCFLNQVPVIHILPTFIPLFLISPILLLLLQYKLDYVLAILSLCLFMLGSNNIIRLGIGEEAVFPFLLWQIFFVFGCLWGKLSLKVNDLDKKKLICWSIIFLGISILMKYGGYFNYIHELKSSLNIYPKKFPLNIYGAVYGGSFLLFLYMIITAMWGVISRYNVILNFLGSMGKNSFVVFVVHVYFYYLLRSFTQLQINNYFICILSLISIYLIYKFCIRIEAMRRQGEMHKLYKLAFE
ncbi:MAG: acyltransferase family protein [Deltaproteobacteria bacterium]